MTDTDAQAIETLLLEERRYPPPPAFAAQANAQPELYDESFEAFWEREGRERITWFEPFTRLLEWERPYAKWYLGGKLNIAYNCVDRHVEAGRGDRVAFHWEGEPADDRRTITYADLQRRSFAAPTRSRRSASARAPRSASTWGWSPRRPSRCWPARGSARRTPSSSAASPPTRSPTG